MRLILNDWPPIASHGAIFIIGYFLASLALVQEKVIGNVTNEYIGISIKQEQLVTRFQVNKDTHSSGDLVMVKIPKKSGKHCIDYYGKVKLIQQHPIPVIGIKKSQKIVLKKLVDSGFSSEFKFLRLHEVKKLKICKNKPRVTYG